MDNKKRFCPFLADDCTAETCDLGVKDTDGSWRCMLAVAAERMLKLFAEKRPELYWAMIEGMRKEGESHE
jgi:hypothetical protein